MVRRQNGEKTVPGVGGDQRSRRSGYDSAGHEVLTTLEPEVNMHDIIAKTRSADAAAISLVSATTSTLYLISTYRYALESFHCY